MRCKECYGTGLTDNHVTGEVYCSACDGTGQASTKVVDTTDELHQILKEALEQVPPPPRT
jgi:DnaJ-class molecular chaperone